MRNLALITCVSLLASTSSYAVTLNSLFDVNPETARYCKEATIKGIFGEPRTVYECPNVVPDQRSGVRDPLTTGSIGSSERHRDRQHSRPWVVREGCQRPE